MLAETPYGTTPPSAPCSAQAGIGLLRSLPITPSNASTSPGAYRRPSRLSNDRFSNSTSTTWSSALSRVGVIVRPYASAGGPGPRRGSGPSDGDQLGLQPHDPVMWMSPFPGLPVKDLSGTSCTLAVPEVVVVTIFPLLEAQR